MNFTMTEIEREEMKLFTRKVRLTTQALHQLNAMIRHHKSKELTSPNLTELIKRN